MTATRESIFHFLNFCDTYIRGREKQESQTFLNEFFKAFGHEGAIQAGATFELPIPKVTHQGNIGFADLWWPRDRLATLLIEMKSRGENLNKHYAQAWDYSKQLNPRPKYVILCNFDEFWIYDFDIQIDTPVDKIRLIDLYERLDAFRFMEFTAEAPKFRNNQVEITQLVAKRMGELYQLLKARCKRDNFTELIAQKFILQCVMAMFAEDTNLLQNDLFSTCVTEYLEEKSSSFNLLNDGLFRRMNMLSTPVDRYQGVDYFNGGLFSQVYNLELTKEELNYLKLASEQDWSRVRPAIFGSIFESTMNQKERHRGGVHFTAENDIMKVIHPTINKYWEQKIKTANSLKELEQLKLEIQQYKVLDPACGSGNFLYMAYQELKQNEQILLEKIAFFEDNINQQSLRLRAFASQKNHQFQQATIELVTPQQFYGIDQNSFAVELAKVTLLIARQRAINQLGLSENPLPLDSLDNNIIKGDALLINWPSVNAIIGNPPFQSKNKMQQEFGKKYVNLIREKYPEIPGRADYCIYWFYKTHQNLPENGRAGLVGTNTISQNYSREGGLDYIVNNGGTIIEAVASQVWSGEAAVHVSIVNWIKGEYPGIKRLYRQLGEQINSPWEVLELDYINSSLSEKTDVSQAKIISTNAKSGTCYQGQTHGHEGFLLTTEEAREILNQSQSYKQVIFPYLTGDELLSKYPTTPQRYVIDFYPLDEKAAKKYPLLFKRIKNLVLPTRQEAAQEEITRNEEARKNNPKAKINKHHQNFLAKWWLLSYPRPELITKIKTIPRYIACSQVTKIPIFEFVSAEIRPNAALIVFPLADDYSFGILQSSFHCQWFAYRCSTLATGFRYTSNTVFDTFPFPQNPQIEHIEQVRKASVNLREIRRQVMIKNSWSLREIYRHLTDNSEHKDIKLLQESHLELDQAVRLVYGMSVSDNLLSFLLNLNLEITAKEARGEKITAPGLPSIVTNPQDFISNDCVNI